MNDTLTPADIAAVTGNNNGNGAFGDGWWGIILFAMIFGPWGRGGFGGWGGNGGDSASAPVTQADLCNAMNANNLENAVGRMYDNQNAIARQTDNAICNSEYTNAQLHGQTQLQISQGVNAIQAQNAQCCCDVKQLIMETQYKNEANKCEVLSAIKEGDWNAERRCLEQKLETERAKNTQMANAMEATQTRAFIAEQFCGVPKMPQTFTYAVPFNWNYGCNTNQCCRTAFQEDT